MLFLAGLEDMTWSPKWKGLIEASLDLGYSPDDYFSQANHLHLRGVRRGKGGVGSVALVRPFVKYDVGHTQPSEQHLPRKASETVMVWWGGAGSQKRRESVKVSGKIYRY